MNSPKIDRNRCVGDFCLKLLFEFVEELINYICVKSNLIGKVYATRTGLPF